MQIGKIVICYKQPAHAVINECIHFRNKTSIRQIMNGDMTIEKCFADHAAESCIESAVAHNERRLFNQ